ncbi:MAG: hypothetical protein IJ190_07625 [Prevotella sp.]|nr:hypothetical protein [Prevotella sp.]
MRKIIHRYTVLFLTMLLVGTGIALADTDVILLGDVNGDGEVNTEDVTTLVDYLHDSSVSVNLTAADVNRDESIDIADVTAINNIITSGTFDKGTASTLFFPAPTVEKTYGDAAFTNQLVRSGSTGAITYESSAPGVATVNETTGEVTITGAGTATITATLADKDGINGATADYTVTVTEKEVTVSGITANDKEYDGTTTATLDYAGVTIEGKVGNDELTVTATGTFADANVGTGKIVNISDIALSGAKAGNYKLAATGNQTTATANITAVAVSVTTAPKAVTGSQTYNGNAQTLFSEGTSSSGGTMKYKVTDSSTKPASTTGFTTSIPQRTDAGTYYLWYYVEGDGNHTGTEINNDVISKTIDKATPTVTAPTAKTLTYSGSAQALVNAGSTTGGTLQYSLDGSSYGTDIPTATDIGDYTVYYRVVGDDNYKDVTAQSITATISYLLLSNATPSDIGKLICASGHIHAYGADAACEADRVAIIAYVGSAGSVETGNSTYKGLAIAMSDANSGSTCQWKSSNDGTCVSQNSVTATALGYKDGIASTNTLTSSDHSEHGHDAAIAAVSNNDTASPEGCSGWFLPSLGQWQLIVQGLTGKSTTLTTSTNREYQAAAVNTKITAAGGTGVQANYYWSSTECYTGTAWYMYFGSGNVVSYNTASSDYVRSALAF